MTAVKTISEANSIARKFGQVVFIDNIDQSHESTKLFYSVVSNRNYGAQCIHHALVLRINFAAYAVAQGGSAAKGGVIFACIFHFHQQLIQTYDYCLNAIRAFSFTWITAIVPFIPLQYDKLCRESYATDLESFAEYFHLSRAIRKATATRGLLFPPARMIRPTTLVFWNALKGGLDEYSRAMQNFTRRNKAENYIVTIMTRLLMTQVCNAAVAHRQFRAKQLSILPSTVSLSSIPSSRSNQSYKVIRHKVTQVETMADFVRSVGRE